jgi:hypothetical protein
MPAGEKRHSTHDYSAINYILLNISSNIKKRSDEVFIPWSFLRHGFTGQWRRVSSKSSLDKRFKVEASSRSDKARWALHEGSLGEGVQSWKQRGIKDRSDPMERGVVVEYTQDCPALSGEVLEPAIIWTAGPNTADQRNCVSSLIGGVGGGVVVCLVYVEMSLE